MNNTFAFNDPLIGETHISAEKLNAVWQANGGCGLVVLPEPDPLIPESAAPLFAGAGALATLAALGALGANRKGIGGALSDDSARWWRGETTQSVTNTDTPSNPGNTPPIKGDDTSSPQSGGSGNSDGSGSSETDERRNRFDWEAWWEQENERFKQALNEARGVAKTEAESAFAKYQKMKDETWNSREDETMPANYWEIVERLKKIEEENQLAGAALANATQDSWAQERTGGKGPGLAKLVYDPNPPDPEPTVTWYLPNTWIDWLRWESTGINPQLPPRPGYTTRTATPTPRPAQPNPGVTIIPPTTMPTTQPPTATNTPTATTTPTPIWPSSGKPIFGSNYSFKIISNYEAHKLRPNAPDPFGVDLVPVNKDPAKPANVIGATIYAVTSGWAIPGTYDPNPLPTTPQPNQQRLPKLDVSVAVADNKGNKIMEVVYSHCQPLFTEAKQVNPGDPICTIVDPKIDIRTHNTAHLHLQVNQSSKGDKDPTW